MSSRTPTSRREFIRLGVATAVGFGVASAIEIPIFTGSIQNDNTIINQKDSQIKQLQGQAQTASQLEDQLIAIQALRTLGVDEVNGLQAMVGSIISSNQNGTSVNKSDVVSFIDSQLQGVYGNTGNKFMANPITATDQTGPLNVDNVVYNPGSVVGPYIGSNYQYNLTLRQFWRTGLLALEDYSTNAYGNKFEKLTADQQRQVLSDLNNNKPTNFNGISPQDFYNEVTLITNTAVKVLSTS